MEDMTRIVVTCPMNLSTQQKARLDKLGEVTYYDTHPTPKEWLKRCEGYEIICSWFGGLRENINNIKNVFVSVPAVGVRSFAEPSILKANNVTLCNSPGCNRHAVSEWTTYMLIESMRHIGKYINTTKSVLFDHPPIGLAGKKIAILGYGDVGKQVGKICEAFGMKVSYFKRGDNLRDAVRYADVVVDVLSANPTSVGLLNADFFESLKDGVVFISVTVDSIVDIDAMLASLESGKLACVAHDVMNAKPGDASDSIYNKIRNHPNVLVTPHIAGFSDVTNKIGNDLMIDNVEAWLKGKPINVIV